MLSNAELKKISVDGFIFKEKLSRFTPTLDFANAIGQVVNLNNFDQGYPNKVVQTLIPRDKCYQNSNHYYGNYGYEAYPMHTDLAQWARPPRYLILRGSEGNSDVSTLVIDAITLARLLPISLARRAVFLPRRSRTNIALRFTLEVKDGLALRWDPLFLRPLNSSAQDVQRILQSGEALRSTHSFTLKDCSSMLIIDNWRCLHGRGLVSDRNYKRSVERIYLEDLYVNAG